MNNTETILFNETEKTFCKARIICVQKNRYTVLTADGTGCEARLKGKFHNLNLEPPVTGDYVMVQMNRWGDALIDEVLPRKTVFTRPDRCGHQESYVKNLKQEVLVSNFDYVFIVTALNQDYSENRIARYVSITLQTGAVPVVILTKTDLCDDVALKVEITKAVCPKAEVYAVCSLTGQGIQELSRFLQKGVTVALLGSSGAGKSTLLNTLSGAAVSRVNEIRDADGKGRHTTTNRQLYELACGAWIMDTAGLREIGVADVEDGIDRNFEDITSLFEECRFNDCSHTGEPGCAVQKALLDGTLSESRWELYRSLHEESRWGSDRMKRIAKLNKNLARNRYAGWNV